MNEKSRRLIQDRLAAHGYPPNWRPDLAVAYGYQEYLETQSPGGKIQLDPLTFHENDVLFGKGGTRHKHPGNVKLTEMAEGIREEYNRANPLEKRPIVSRLIESIHQSGGRFLMYDKKRNVWKVADPLSAHDKVLQHIVPSDTVEDEVDEECSGPQWPTAMAVDPPIVPHQNDILMGRGGNTNMHAGNQSLRGMALSLREKYKASRKKEKSMISRELVRKVRDLAPPGRFLNLNKTTQAWEDVGDEKAREKVSQVLRDAVAGRAGLETMEEENTEEQKKLPVSTAPTIIEPDDILNKQNDLETEVQCADVEMQPVEQLSNKYLPAQEQGVCIQDTHLMPPPAKMPSHSGTTILDTDMASIGTFSLSSASKMNMSTAGISSGSSIRTDAAVSSPPRHSSAELQIALILAQQRDLLDECNKEKQSSSR